MTDHLYRSRVTSRGGCVWGSRVRSPARQVVHHEIGGRLTLPQRLVGTDEASDLAQAQNTLTRRPG